MDGSEDSILVVEDDASLRMLYRLNLGLEGFRVREAANPVDVRSALAEARPALVLLDMHLDNIPSDDLLDEIRAAGIPVILISGTADLTRYDGRADEILGKPFDNEALVAAARRYVVG